MGDAQSESRKNPLMKRVYFDYAASSPLRPEVFAAMEPWLTEGFGNANALYREGKQARQALDDARASIAANINASPTEIVFTSGGTESNNALIAGITHAIRTKKGRDKGGNHIVSSAFEHHAVLEPIQALKRLGYEVTLVKPTREGFICPEAFSAALRPDTILASIIMAQNELGTIQPIAELVDIAQANGAVFHSDAVQALGKIAIDVRRLGIDAASFSAHKIGGPKGVGAFYLKGRTAFSAVQLGGGQEAGRRSGTQNVAGAVGFAKALELAQKEREQEALRLTDLRNRLASGLLALDNRISLTVDCVGSKPSNSKPDSSHLPGMLSLLVAGYESETLILKLDDRGFAVSGGSACSTGSLEPSHVLMSLGLTRDQAYGALRISLGRENTEEDVESFVSAFATLLAKPRQY